jgi:hypothetical protein
LVTASWRWAETTSMSSPSSATSLRQSMTRPWLQAMPGR